MIEIPRDEHLVSCVMATGTRPRFLRQGVHYFLRQTYPNSELIIVDDGPTPIETDLPVGDRIRYIFLDRKTNLGRKLNVGVEAAEGEIIQKLDDDDYYHPEFLERNVATLLASERTPALVGYGRFLVLLLRSREVVDSGEGWFAGGTLCFHKDLWRAAPFRDDMHGPSDWWFTEFHKPVQIAVDFPGVYIYVRHEIDHLWTRLHAQDVSDYFRRQPAYGRQLKDLVSTDDLKFYEEMRKELVR